MVCIIALDSWVYALAAVQLLVLPTCKKPRTGSRINVQRREIRDGPSCPGRKMEEEEEEEEEGRNIIYYDSYRRKVARTSWS